MQSTAETDINDPGVHVPGVDKQQEADVFVASQYKLMWLRFRKHKLAMIGGIVTILIYLVALFAEFLAPFPSGDYSAEFLWAPPQRVHLIDTSDGFKVSPFVYGYKSEVDPVALRRTFVIDEEQKIPIRFFVKGYDYKILGIIPSNIHLMAPVDPEQPMFLLGADRLGRDVFSRFIYGTRISMSIGLVGVFVSLILGITIGGISGYYGGTVDNITQRIIEFIRSMPTIPLWLGLAAALPLTWSPLLKYILPLPSFFR